MQNPTPVRAVWIVRVPRSIVIGRYIETDAVIEVILSFQEQHQQQWVLDPSPSKRSCQSNLGAPYVNEERIIAWIRDNSVVTKKNLGREGIQVSMINRRIESKILGKYAFRVFSLNIESMIFGKSLEEL